ncbi:hypothetical protein MOX02_55510 [Methylobacterium oxalidis]|uniref:LysR substrate-binding domain-containing protein n=1 Tax=Methylobacterium oxalidis TaxID=944322 RepID=A0A512JC49_9HYPH|nr:hypothetical protein MOX02_55510 [Methylobacterium oxalidis]GJE30755.1 hypothetical protein LDDCCGHA_0924 [Methylobacterium oxalidis]GLS64261.1 hypothetical protein GCM10007888_26420 [Methylobacterium oxalidis]
MAVPLYQEEYRLITAADGPCGDCARVTWAEVGRLTLCLLTPNMQNRRTIDQQIRATGREPAPTLETNLMILLMTHVRTLRWASIMPAALADLLPAQEGLRAIPIVEPTLTHMIGLVALQREPATPLVTSLMAVARQLGRSLGRGTVTTQEGALDRYGRRAQRCGRCGICQTLSILSIHRSNTAVFEADQPAD